MKKYLAGLLLALCGGTALAQNTEGIVLYDQKVNVHRRLPDEAMKAMVPEFRTNKMQLAVRGGESLFKSIESNDEPIEASGGARLVIRVPQNEIYRNFEQKKSVELRELAGQKFLIQDSLRQVPWKLTGESKKIHGYDCLKATYIQPERQQPIVAWFTDAIPCPSGPAVYGGLPGLILELDVNEGEMIYTATSLGLKKLTGSDLKVPSGGKKVSEAEFNKIRDEYMKEMGNGGMRIIRN
ncbi:GLPGLI family protein [Rhabdobacter roseus]|uniref:GLPGLI family protein n=1 Tax=Rhabdobacter roseus TaxID=1655419 RepID=A0A840TZ44_9BACT|nr:GLPGLI family protein [Rhabdobacter roseus]MBB5285170.1 GLPGLI family protein [Rhabdobacter roseus]